MRTPVMIMVIAVCIAACTVAYGQPSGEPGMEISQAQNQMQVLAERTAAAEVLQRQVTNDVTQIFDILKAIDQEVKIIHKEVDRPLISDLWFGFVSDRFTAVLNRVFGFDSGPSLPLWAVGFLSLGLLILRTLLFILNRFKADSTAAKLLGRTFGVLVSLYLLGKRKKRKGSNLYY